MPRFPVAFGKRKSAANEDVPEKQSFRVYERTEVASAGAKSFDVHGVSRQGRPVTTPMPRSHTQPDLFKGHGEEDNMFSGLSANRGSGSSNTTKTASTDTSSRHSAASTAPSAAPSSDPGHHQDEARVGGKKPYGDIPIPPVPKSSSGFLNRAGRTFSFGSTKKSLHPMPVENSETPPPVPTHDFSNSNGRPRGLTTSTTSTATPPKLDDEEFNLDLGSDFGKMFTSLDKRASVATVRDDSQRERGVAPRSLTSTRVNQPSPLHSESIPKPPYSPYSANSDHSNDGLLGAGASSPLFGSPGERPPQAPRHGSPMVNRPSRPSDIIEDEDASLLKESLAASSVLGNSSVSQNTGRYRRNEDLAGSGSGSSWRDSARSTAWADNKEKEDNLFDNSLISSARAVNRYVARAPSPPRNRVMTPAQFEKFRQEKERTSAARDSGKATETKDDDDDEDNYEDDEDEVEKSKQAAKQRRKQEAHMTVYRQQMMKVTGESANPQPRPNLPTSMSTPNMMASGISAPGAGDDGSDEDEEIPLAILAAHGFPSKNRPPTRLSSVGSNPNLRASMAPSPQPPKAGLDQNQNANANASGSGTGTSRASHLPAFARNLPQDPFLGAGLVRNSMRESLAMGGGVPAPHPPQPSQAPLPPGGLVGVIASEERSRAMRRGSPQMDNGRFSNSAGFEPMGGMAPQAMYGMGGSPSMPQLPTMGGMGPMGMPQMPQMMLTPGDQAQIQMTQQMQQFMQMQMQFMQMMTANQGGAGPGAMGGPGGRPVTHMPSHSMGDISSRHSFVGDQAGGQGLGPPGSDPRMRTMSMVQPSSSSWIQPAGGFAPSIRLQGDGYAPSIAPSERSNIGLPGRYRPVSHAPPAEPARRVSTMSGAITGWDDTAKPNAPAKSGNNSEDEDDESGWEAMKAKREKKKSIWRSKKGFGKELSALIS